MEEPLQKKVSSSIRREATDGEKTDCANEIRAYLKTLKLKARNKVASILVKNAVAVGTRREEGQLVTNWGEVVRYYRKHRPHEDEQAYQIMYKLVSPNYELEIQHDLQHEENLEYRKWDSSDREIKGFLAKMGSLGMKTKRKEIKWVNRREDADEDENGKKIERRNKHNRKFDKKKHSLPVYGGK